MVDPELEKKLQELKEQKKLLVRKFTRKSIDAINLSEQVSLTHCSIVDSNCGLELKAKAKAKAKKEKDKQKAKKFK
jgi:hypothetical protein